MFTQGDTTMQLPSNYFVFKIAHLHPNLSFAKIFKTSYFRKKNRLISDPVTSNTPFPYSVLQW
jgi:hypothetical protein